MLSIHPPNPTTTKTNPITPNLLPTSLNHSGPIPVSRRYWNPTTTSPDDTKTAYFRGRKLRGRTVKIPEGYHGAVLQKTEEKVIPQTSAGEGRDLVEELRRMEEGDGEEEGDGMEGGAGVETKVMETRAVFEEVVVWGHEAVPGDEDVYVRGVEEWIGFAEAMHSTS